MSVSIQLIDLFPSNLDASRGQIQLAVYLSNGSKPIANVTTVLSVTKYPEGKKDLLAQLQISASDYTPGKIFATDIYRSIVGHKTAGSESVQDNVIANEFALTFTHIISSEADKDETLVPEGWTTQPTVEVSFVYGDAMGALTNDKPVAESSYSAFNIRIDPHSTQSADGESYPWDTSQPGQTLGEPVWKLFPTDQNPHVLGAPDSSGASVTFIVRQITTMRNKLLQLL